MRIFSNFLSTLVKSKVVDRKIGFLNLMGEKGSKLINQDRESFGKIFVTILNSDSTPPVCKVLMVYCNINTDSTIYNTSLSLSDIIKQSESLVVIVASENSAENYIKISRNFIKGVNLVLTIDRRGDCFPIFFKNLFELMNKGMTMPLAWSELAPQYPRADHLDCPETVMFCGAGQVSFK